MSPHEICETIREHVSMRAVAEHYGFNANRAGFITCPFHSEKTASCKIYDSSFYCFGCGVGGDVVSFVQKLFTLNFKAAVVRISCDFDLKIFSASPSERRKMAEVDKRRIKEQAAQKEFVEKRRRYLAMRCELWQKQKKIPLTENERIKLDTLDYWLDQNP